MIDENSNEYGGIICINNQSIVEELQIFIEYDIL